MVEGSSSTSKLQRRRKRRRQIPYVVILNVLRSVFFVIFCIGILWIQQLQQQQANVYNGKWKPFPMELYRFSTNRNENDRDVFHHGIDDDDDIDDSSLSCDPKHIHIAQRTNVNEHNRISMTVSLSLDYKRCKNVKPLILYGMKSVNDSNETATRAVIGENPLQYNYTYKKTMRHHHHKKKNKKKKALYQSDWIYHIEIPNLQAGLKLYWYKIVTFQLSDDIFPLWLDSKMNSSSSNSSITVLDIDEIERVLNVNSLGSIDDVRNKRRRQQSIRYFFQRSFLDRQRSIRSRFLRETDEFLFRTPPLLGQPISIALVGDLGQTEFSINTMSHILQNSAVMMSDDVLESDDDVIIRNDEKIFGISNVLIAGDISYADSNPHRWTSWFVKMEPLLRSLPLSVAAGNHEIECDLSKRHDVFVHYENLFYNPNRIAAPHMVTVSDDYKNTLWMHSCSCPSEFQGIYEYGNSFYSYTHGLAYIVVLNSYTNANVSSIQYKWLQNELQNNVNRDIHPWLIVSFHAPLYTSFLGHVNELESQTMRESMQPLFDKYDVNLIVSGHDHAYMRTYPMRYNSTCRSINGVNNCTPIIDPTGASPIYLTLGTGGNREGHNRGYVHKFQKEEWVAKRRLSDYGYGLLQIYNSSYAFYGWVKDNYSDKDFQDHLWIYNPHHNNSTSTTTA